MLVSFDFECSTHGRFVEYLDTNDYPGRKWPFDIPCPVVVFRSEVVPYKESYCPNGAVRIPLTNNFIQDSLGVSPSDDKYLMSMGKRYNSKSYLKRDLKTKGLSLLTSDEQIKHKSPKEQISEYMNRPDIVREREKAISDACDSFGVIDGVDIK